MRFLILIIGFLVSINANAFSFNFKIFTRVFATVGIITQIGGYTVHTFLSSGTFTPLKNLTNVEYLVVGGGGYGGLYGSYTLGGSDGTANTGGGGGGNFNAVSPFQGGNGGSGIVIIRYPVNQ